MNRKNRREKDVLARYFVEPTEKGNERREEDTKRKKKHSAVQLYRLQNGGALPHDESLNRLDNVAHTSIVAKCRRQ